jgi:S-adenosylmethionine decarboxylase
MDTLGRHVIAELDGCSADVLSNTATVQRFLREAVRVAGARAIAEEIFNFKEGGVSGFILLAESHLSIHTWPEHGYAAVDIYTCGRHTIPERACDYLAERLGATEVRTIRIDRGLPGKNGGHEQHLASMGMGTGLHRPFLTHLPQSA